MCVWINKGFVKILCILVLFLTHIFYQRCEPGHCTYNYNVSNLIIQYHLEYSKGTDTTRLRHDVFFCFGTNAKKLHARGPRADSLFVCTLWTSYHIRFVTRLLTFNFLIVKMTLLFLPNWQLWNIKIKIVTFDITF